MGEIIQPENLVISTETVDLPNGDRLAVRGLGLPQIMQIYRQNADQIEELYHLTKSLAAVTSPVELVADLAANAESLALDIIACAIGGPHLRLVANDLPASVQFTVLLTCFNLTVQKEGGLEKLVESVMQIVALLSKARSLIQPQSGLPDTGAK